MASNNAELLQNEYGWVLDIASQLNASYTAHQIQEHDFCFGLAQPYQRESKSKKRKRKRVIYEQTELDEYLIAALASFQSQLSCFRKVPLSTKTANDEKSTKHSVSNFPSSTNMEFGGNDQVTDLVTQSSLGQIVLPPQSKFLMSDLSQIQLLLSYRPPSGYNALVMDPPWPNKSVRRGNKYQTLSLEQLESLPLDSLSGQGCIVAVWVTNDPAVTQFVKEILFPAQNIIYHGTWYWLKVTDSGEPIIPMGGSQSFRRPFEQLILGIAQPPSNDDDDEAKSESHTTSCHICLKHNTDQAAQLTSSSQEASQTFSPTDPNTTASMSVSKPNEDQKIQNLSHLQASELRSCCVRRVLPVRRVICSVPGQNTHSRKPQLNTLISHFLKQAMTLPMAEHSQGSSLDFTSRERASQASSPTTNQIDPAVCNITCLELFARNLIQGWHSWGNQVLRFQTQDYFKPIGST